MAPPTGTVTFLCNDIEGSTKLAQEFPDKGEIMQARPHTILRESIESNNGYVFQISGDAFCAAFHTASDGLNAVIEVQRKLQNENRGETSINVRMGIRTGTTYVGVVGAAEEVTEIAGLGIAPTLCAHLSSKAAAGEILISEDSVKSGILMWEDWNRVYWN